MPLQEIKSKMKHFIFINYDMKCKNNLLLSMIAVMSHILRFRIKTNFCINMAGNSNCIS